MHRVAAFAAFALALAVAGRALAADVAVGVTNGTLTLTGTTSDDALSIDSIGVANAKEFRVVPGPGVTVNGQLTPQIFGGVTKDIVIGLGGGVDEVSLVDVRPPRDVVLNGGFLGATKLNAIGCDVRDGVFANTAGGLLDVTIERTIVRGDVRFTGQGVADVLGFDTDAQIHGDVRFAGGGGDDSLECEKSQVRGALVFDGGAGNDICELQFSGVGGPMRFSGASGDDAIVCDVSEVRGALRFVGDIGGDTVVLNQTTLLGPAALALGDGDNTVQMMQTTAAATLKITGGANQDEIIAMDNVHVSGNLKCALGDGANLFTLGGVTVDQGIQLKCGIGFDVITVNDTTVLRDLRVQPNPGPSILVDSIALDSVAVLGNLRVTAPSATAATVDDTRIGGGVFARFGLGNNMLLITDSTVGRVFVKGIDGPETIELSETTNVRGDFVAKLGDGANVVKLLDCGIAGDVAVKTGAGDDTFDFTGAVIGGTTSVNGGGGADVGP